MSDALDPNIVLTGFMGTGKSAVGKRVATMTGRTFVDIDQEIISKHGSIPEIFQAGGEEQFRKIEREIVAEIAPRRNQVIATGGGTLLDADNIVAFLGAEVYTLTAEPDEIERRVRADGIESRPLLANSENVSGTIAALMAERSEAYAKFTAVDTTGKSVDGVVDALRAAGAPIATEQTVDPTASKDKTNQVLYGVIGIAFVIAVVLLLLVLSF